MTDRQDLSPTARFLRHLRRGLARSEAALDRGRRWAKRALGLQDPPYIQPFRTWAVGRTLWVRGRVLEDKGIRERDDGSILSNLVNAFHRFESDEIPGVEIEVGVGPGGAGQVVVTDEEGFYDGRIEVPEGFALRSPWTEVPLVLRAREEGSVVSDRAVARISVPDPEARFGVISDMDDTVIRTGATDFLKRLRVELLHDARSREAFPGVGPFYRALSDGGRNPFFYVSSSPWNLYDLFERFLEHHRIPPGPILLKEMGLTAQRWLKGGHDDYKSERIGEILEAFPDLRFVLVGDSGQRDPFVYEKVVEEHPGRILAVYIRDVSDEGRDREVREVARRLAERGVDLLLMPDCRKAARHARDEGWITDREASRVEEALDGTGDDRENLQGGRESLPGRRSASGRDGREGAPMSKSFTERIPGWTDGDAGSRWLVAGAGFLAGSATRLLLRRAWKARTGEDPPRDPVQSGTGWAEAVVWTLAVGVAVGTARLLARNLAREIGDRVG